MAFALAAGPGTVTSWASPGVRVAEKDTKAAYRKAYERGRSLFKRKHWKAARKQFVRAYDLRPRPIVLFNIASTYRREGDAIQALFYYHRYLKEAGPDGKYSAFTKSAIAKLEADIAREAARAESNKAPSVAKKPRARRPVKKTAPKPARPAPEPEGGPSRGLQFTGIGLVVLGLGGVGLGGYQAHRAQQIASEFGEIDRGSVWTQDLQDRYDDGQAHEIRAVIFTALGGAAIIAGTVLYIVGQGEESEETQNQRLSVLPTVEEHALGVTVNGSF